MNAGRTNAPESGAAAAAVGLADRVTRGDNAAGEPGTPGDYLVVDVHSGRYYGLDDVGEFVWLRLDGARTLQAIAREVATHYDVAEDRAAADLLEFVTRLHEAGLVSRTAAP